MPEIHELQEVETMLAERVKEWTQQWKQEGWQEGKKEGRQVGRQEGRLEEGCALLKRQLNRRFQTLPQWAEERLEHATQTDLEHWADNILDATTVEEVFSD